MPKVFSQLYNDVWDVWGLHKSVHMEMLLPVYHEYSYASVISHKILLAVIILVRIEQKKFFYPECLFADLLPETYLLVYYNIC